MTTSRNANPRKYHTRVCRSVKQSRNHYYKPRNVLSADLEPCQYCTGTKKRSLHIKDVQDKHCSGCWEPLENPENDQCEFCNRFDAVMSRFEYFDAPLDSIRVILDD